MLRVSAIGLITVVAASAATTSSGPVTFNKDVLPILQRNCQGCHRPGEVAPMSLLSYKESRPYAKAIKAAVLKKQMPPWFADARYGHFSNERKLSDLDTQTLIAWVDAGAPEGDAKDKPQPVKFVDGWNIPVPDKVFEMPEPFNIPASGTIDYNYLVLPTGFTKDTWVSAAEVRPGNRAVVHHVIAFIRPPGSPWLKDAKPGVPFVPGPERARSGRRSSADPDGSAQMNNVELLAGYAPGLQEQNFKPGEATLVPAGSDIVLQLHYTANGTAGTDQTRVGVVFAKEPVTKRVFTLSASNGSLAIPPGDPNYETHSHFTLHEPAELVWMMPHMHLRGKDFEYRAVYPTGETQTLLSVPKYSFSWQLEYTEAKPLVLPAGTRIECTAHFDNSPNNPANPDPAKEVHWGDQSWDEMMIGWFGVAIDAHADPMKLFAPPKQAKQGE